MPTDTVHLNIPYGSLTSSNQEILREVLDACARHLGLGESILLYGGGPAGALLRSALEEDGRFAISGVVDRKAVGKNNSILCCPEGMADLHPPKLVLITTSPVHYAQIERTIRCYYPEVLILLLFAPQSHGHLGDGKRGCLDDKVVAMLHHDIEAGNLFKCNFDLRTLRQRHPNDPRLAAIALKLREIVLNNELEASQLINNVLGPYTTNIQIVDNCNLRCFMCLRQRDDGLVRESFFSKPMSRETFERFTSAIPASTAEVILGGSGEAMLHKDFLYFVDKLLERGKRVKVVTNGTLLHRKLADELGRRHGFDLQLSLDGLTSATYESIRIGARFEAVLENFSRLASVVDRNSTDSFLEIVTVLMRRNIEEFPAIIEWAASLGVRSVHGLFLFMQGQAPKTPEESLIFHPVLYDTIRKQSLKIGDRLGVNVTMPAPLAFDAPPLQKESPLAPFELCLAPWSRLDMGIGGFPVCCGEGPFISYQADFLEGESKVPFTFNALTGGYENLSALYNGDLLQSVRRGLLMGRPMAACSRCKDQHLLSTGYQFDSAFSPTQISSDLYVQAKSLFLKKFRGTPYAARMLPNETIG